MTTNLHLTADQVSERDNLKSMLREFMRCYDLMDCDCERAGFAHYGKISPTCHKHQFDCDEDFIHAVGKALSDNGKGGA